MNCIKNITLTALLGLSFASQGALLKAQKALDNADYATAISELRETAKVGNPKAQFMLGVLHYQGKAGKPDYKKAAGWLFLASEYDYPQSLEYAGKIFQGMSKEQQADTTSYIAQLQSQYGEKTLLSSIYPEISEKAIPAQLINKRAKKVISGKLYYDRSRQTGKRLHNQVMIDRALKSYSSGQGATALNNLSQTMIKGDTGITIVQFDVGIDGTARDPEILFSWPKGVFDKGSVHAILTSKFKPAQKMAKRSCNTACSTLLGLVSAL